ncbi:type II toxin-antitoxin system VapC family toxin [Halosimplex pelagicum]|uniref:Type II toxin-antitoxin system VapC family toxin n=2 Tax=Halosimplex pelagicum TaxID=869886 RepID=A0A7D5TD07_9EURY|nr:type II toxin-antitoxin system VapC family toxin [Halosimplex pelagicum]
MLCLDNDVFRKYTTDPPDGNVVDYLAEHHDDPWGLPAVVLFEWLQVYESHDTIRTKRSQVDSVVDEVLPLDVAVEAANMRARLAATDTTLDLADLLIAATAREADATLVTANENDFDKPPIHELLDVDIVDT